MINGHGNNPFEGMMRYDAIEKALEEKGLYHGKVPHKMRLGLWSGSGEFLEPITTSQCYVNCSGMTEKACGKVRDGRLKIVLKESTKTRGFIG